MTLVDVAVPSLGRRYHFSLEDTVSVQVLIREIVEVVCQKEHCGLSGALEALSLYRMGRGTRLASEGTLEQYGICSGETLLLL